MTSESKKKMFHNDPSSLEGLITEQEMTNITGALKDPEFRKLLAEYCDEVADPKNRAVYEQELTQYEAQRGIQLTFVTPEPGFVIKTVLNGEQKVFINVSQNEKVERPTSHVAHDDSGRRGRQWSIPLTQAPPHRDYDKKKKQCNVYDVVFHPEALKMAENREFRKLLIETALDAVESAFQVKLDRVNVKFPKMSFKGVPRPTVIRKKMPNFEKYQEGDKENANDKEEDEHVNMEQFYPKVDSENLNGDRPPQLIQIELEKNNRDERILDDRKLYTEPKYKLVHRRNVASHEMTYERDAKLNVTLPHEFVITVQLPLLDSSEHVQLDVKGKTVDLVCDIPAKYKLQVNLPYVVLEDQCRAKFDKEVRQLVISLPVDRRRELGMVDLNHKNIVEEIDFKEEATELEEDDQLEEEENSVVKPFLCPKVGYILPTFTTNVLVNDLFVTIPVNNVDPSSMEWKMEEECEGEEFLGTSWLHLKFFNLSSGYAPGYYAFYVRFSECVIESHSVECEDKNVVLKLRLSEMVDQFEFGLDGDKVSLHTIGAE